MYNLIVAYDCDFGIGKDNKLPWYFPEDLKYFSELTKGNGNNAIIMGKNTWNSLPKKPLPKRDNLILSTTLDISENTAKNNLVKTFKNIDNIEKHCLNTNYDDIWIIGGSEIYNLFIKSDKIKYIYATIINKKYDCDTFFPNLENWYITDSINKLLNNINISYVKYKKN